MTETLATAEGGSMSETLEQIALRVANEACCEIWGIDDLVVPPSKDMEDFVKANARRLVAALGAQSAVGELPEGRKIYAAPVVNPDWPMVPKEPTNEMLSTLHGTYIRGESLEMAYQAMLAAAPKPSPR